MKKNNVSNAYTRGEVSLDTYMYIDNYNIEHHFQHMQADKMLFKIVDAIVRYIPDGFNIKFSCDSYKQTKVNGRLKLCGVSLYLRDTYENKCINLSNYDCSLCMQGQTIYNCKDNLELVNGQTPFHYAQLCIGYDYLSKLIFYGHMNNVSMHSYSTRFNSLICIDKQDNVCPCDYECFILDKQ